MKVFKDEDQMQSALVKVLKEIRINLGLSQPELEAKLNVGSEYISKVERGKLKVNLDLLRRFTTVFDMSISDIIKRAEVKNGLQ